MPSEKETQFERLWEGETPSGKNESKALQFRQKMTMALIQKKAQVTKENAKAYWMGTLRSLAEPAQPEGGDYRSRGPDRQGGRRR